MEVRSVHSSTSDINSEEAAKTEHLIIPRKKRICLVGAVSEDILLSNAAQQFNVPIVKSETGVEYIEDTTYCTYFILKKFEGQEYDLLHKTAHRILGPTALLQLAEKKESLPSINRPMYTQAMLGTVIVFTGFRIKEELTKLIDMIHHMGGSVRREISHKATHLIANCCGGEKYRYAVTFSVPIMSANWVTTLWELRDDISSISVSEEMIATFKLKPFFGARICFFGFPEEEKRHMCEVLQQQGGEPTEINDPNCTHVVTDMGKHRYKIMSNPKLSFSCSRLPSDTRCTKPNPKLRDQKYSFAYYDPYTNTIPNTSKSIFASRLAQSQKRKHRADERSITDDIFDNEDTEELLLGLDVSCATFNAEVQEKEELSGKREEKEENRGENDEQVIKVPSVEKCWERSSSGTDALIRAEANDRIDQEEYEDGYECAEDEKELEDITPKSSKQWCTIVGLRSSKRATTPRRYVRWRKTSTWSAISKPPASRSPRLRYSSLAKRHSYPVARIHEAAGTTNAAVSPTYVTDNTTTNITPNNCHITTPTYATSTTTNTTTNTTSASVDASARKARRTPKAIARALRQGSAIFSKISEIVLPSALKDLIPVTRYRPGEQEQRRDEEEAGAVAAQQKYTPLPSPLPVPKKLARLNSNSMRRTRMDQAQRMQRRRQREPKDSPKGVKKAVSAPSVVDAIDCTEQDKTFMLVVDESNVNSLPDLAYARAHIVKAEWFWISVQNEGAADEKEYLFEDYLETVVSPTARRDSLQQQAATPTGTSTRRKRKRLAERLSGLVQNGADSPAGHKRRSSISDAGHLSVSGSFLDCTASPDKQLLDEVEAVNPESARKLSPRHQVFLELLQTESNYVGILSTIMTLFKSPLEDKIETNEELLNSTEAKIIFGNFPPIYEVHKKMLEELRYCASHWSEENSIGNIFLKYASDLIKAYPPYVNFFENTKEMLDQCDQAKPRFHAFLKICQAKPECGRQSLKELLIKPVQRLPSISLLLNDILKHTYKNNPDHGALEKSLNSIKEVMTYINEDKRKTEGQLAMFDIFNEIDNCPPHLVSSHRSFIGKCDVQELSEGLSGRGDHLVLFLFTDTLEICKKRSKAFNSMKSPNTVNGLHSVKMSQGKPYKHIKMLSLSTVKKVFDIRETEECRNVFALLVRSNEELKEKLYSFTITDEEVNKTNYLRTLCRQMANTVCKADADTFLTSLDAHHLQIDTSDVALGTLSKAFKFATRTRMKVGRAFSFNKTPSKLKRAMSTMMSPFGSTTSLTPASQQLAQMRLASCNNINELGNGSGSPTRDEVLVAPLSVQPTRKAKCSTLSIASLRRL